jgi:lysophospholipase L1-like esterase
MKIVCIGSSSVEGIGDRRAIGWVGRLNEYLQQDSSINEYRVFNLGLKGDFLAGTIERYKNESTKRNPHLVIIFTGSNDCITHIKDGTIIKQPNIEEYNTQWNDFLKYLTNAGHKTLVLGPTMVKETLTDYKGMQIIFKNSDLAVYNKNLKQLCADNNIEFLELFDLFKDKTEDYGFDLVHPNTNGYDLIFNKILSHLKHKNLIK